MSDENLKINRVFFNQGDDLKTLNFETFRKKSGFILSKKLDFYFGVNLKCGGTCLGQPGDYLMFRQEDGEIYICPSSVHGENYEKIESDSKTFGNTDSNGTKENVKDVVFFGNGDLFKLISKASSEKQSWMKSTKAMEITGAGCLIQVTTQQGDNVAEALQFVPGVKIHENDEGILSIVSY